MIWTGPSCKRTGGQSTEANLSPGPFKFSLCYGQLSQRQKNVELSKKIRDNTMLKFSEGISSSLEFSQAENQYIENQRSYINAMQSLLFAKEELDKAMGQ
ncbi:MAG: TolC family protein [Owenweeksia sp.]|nr:TolC family protein [Owenweeksia sp.]